MSIVSDSDEDLDSDDDEDESIRKELNSLKKVVSYIRRFLIKKDTFKDLLSESEASKNENENLREIINIHKDEFIKLNHENASLFTVISLLFLLQVVILQISQVRM